MSKQEKVAHLLTETVRVLCQSSFDDWSEMKIQGLLAITLNGKDIFLVQINEAIDSCLSPTTTSQPCSKGVQRATKACVSDNSKDSTVCNNGIVESSCRQSLRSASKSVEKVLNYETVKNTASKKKVLGNKKKNKGRRKWQKRTNKYSVANGYQQHQDGRSKCAKRLTMMRKPLLRRKCKIVRTTKGEKSNSIVQMEMCGSDDDFSNNFDRKEIIADMNSQDEYSCIVCRMTFSKQTHLATHYTACHSENISANFESDETNLCSTSFGLVKCKNGSCTRYFNSRNGMHKHHGRIHGISLPDTRLAMKNKKSKLIRYKSKSHTRLFNSRTRMITCYIHANGNSDEETESTLKTESKEQGSDWLKPHNSGVEMQPINTIASCLNKVSADVNMDMASGCHMLDGDDLPIIVVSSGTTEIWDASCEDLQSEPTQNDQGSCAKQPDLAEALIKTEEFDIIE